MLQFSLSQLLMVAALVAIVASFTQTEGDGDRYAMIEAVSFASGDSRIAVAKLTAREASGSMTLYKSDVARTVSWLNASTGSSSGIVHQDFRAGYCGTAFGFWRVGRTSVLCNPASDQIAASAFGGGDVTRNLGTETPLVVMLGHPACNIAYSNSGRYLAAGGGFRLTVLDTQAGTIAMQVPANGWAFLHAPLMSFTSDETRIVVAGDSGVHVWHIPTSTQVSTVIRGHNPTVNDIAAAPDDTLIVCSNVWVRRYNLAGQIVATLADEGADQCRVSAAGDRLAVNDGSSLAMYDLNSNAIVRSVPLEGVTAMAFSSSGDELAVGDNRGHVTLIETATGNHRWESNPPGRYRCPWTVPAAFLVGWAGVAWRMSKRRKAPKRFDAESVAQDGDHRAGGIAERD